MQKKKTQKINDKPVNIIMPPLKKRPRKYGLTKNEDKFFFLLKYRANFREKINIATQQIFYVMFQEFAQQFEQCIQDQLKDVKNTKYRFLIFFIGHQINNIKNFDMELQEQFNPFKERVEDYQTFYLHKKENFQEYYINLQYIQQEIHEFQINNSKQIKKVVLIFLGMSYFNSQQLCNTLKLLNEDIFFDYPQIQFYMIFQHLEGQKYEIESSIATMRYITFQNSDFYLYQIIYEFIKNSKLPASIFSSQFIKKILEQCEQKISSIDQKVDDWLNYKDIHFLYNYKSIFNIYYVLQEDTNIQQVQNSLNFGFKIAKFIFSKIFKYKKEYIYKLLVQLYSTESSDFFQKIFYKKKVDIEPQNLQIIFDSFLKNCCPEKYPFIKQLQYSIKNLLKINVASTTQSNINKVINSHSDRKDFIFKQNDTKMQSFINFLDVQIRQLLNKPYIYAKQKYPFLVIENYYKIDFLINPDIQARMIRAIKNNKGQSEYLTKFFEILCEQKQNISIKKFYEEFDQKTKKLKPRFQKKNKKDQKILQSLFLYSQCVYEHLGCFQKNKLDDVNFNKLVFSKYIEQIILYHQSFNLQLNLKFQRI